MFSKGLNHFLLPLAVYESSISSIIGMEDFTTSFLLTCQTKFLKLEAEIRLKVNPHLSLQEFHKVLKESISEIPNSAFSGGEGCNHYETHPEPSP